MGNDDAMNVETYCKTMKMSPSMLARLKDWIRTQGLSDADRTAHGWDTIVDQALNRVTN